MHNEDKIALIIMLLFGVKEVIVQSNQENLEGTRENQKSNWCHRENTSKDFQAYLIKGKGLHSH